MLINGFLLVFYIDQCLQMSRINFFLELLKRCLEETMWIWHKTWTILYSPCYKLIIVYYQKDKLLRSKYLKLVTKKALPKKYLTFWCFFSWHHLFQYFEDWQKIKIKFIHGQFLPTCPQMAQFQGKLDTNCFV